MDSVHDAILHLPSYLTLEINLLLLKIPANGVWRLVIILSLRIDINVLNLTFVSSISAGDACYCNTPAADGAL